MRKPAGIILRLNSIEMASPVPFTKADILRMMERVAVVAEKCEMIEKEFQRELQPEMKEAFAMIHSQYKYDLMKEINGLFLWFCSTDTKDQYILGRLKGTNTYSGSDISQ